LAEEMLREMSRAEPLEARVDFALFRGDLSDIFDHLFHALSLRDSRVAPLTAQDEAYCELLLFMVNLIREVGTEAWRMRRKMVSADTGRPVEETERLYRYLESMWDALERAGVEIRDHTGEVVPAGGVYSLKAVAYESVSGASREFVMETIKPTIYFHNRMIQMGEVIVGTPE
jgi:hypothetical protein